MDRLKSLIKIVWWANSVFTHAVNVPLVQRVAHPTAV